MSRRPISIADALAYAPISGTALSDDGRWVALCVPRHDALKGTKAPGLYVLDLDAPDRWRPFGHPEAAFHHPTFAPDGRLAVFRHHGDVSDGVVFDVPADDREGTPIPNLPPAPSSLGWAGMAGHVTVLGLDGAGVRRAWVWDEQGQRRPVTPPRREVADHAFARDGSQLAFLHAPAARVGRPRPPAVLYWTSDPARQPVAVPTPEPLRGFLAWSPGGRWVAGIGRPVDDPLTSPRLWAIAPATGEVRRLLPDVDGWITGFDWRPDGEGVVVAVAQGVEGRVYEADLDGAVRPSGVEGVYLSGPKCARLGGRRLWLRQDVHVPQHVRIADGADDLEGRRLTGFNQRLRETACVPAETVRWTAPDGLDLEGMLLVPPGVSRPPVVAWLHGGPAEHLERTFSAVFQLLVAEGWAVFVPNFRGSTGRDDAFLQALVGKVGDAEITDVLSGLDALSDRVDRDRVGLVGWSFGGAVALCAAAEDARVRAVVAGAPVADWVTVFGSRTWPSLTRAWFPAPPWDDPDAYDRASAVRRLGRMDAPTLLLHGEGDDRVPVSHSRLVYRILQARGVPTDLRLFPGEGHVFGTPWAIKEMLARMLAWFRTHLAPEA